MTAKRLIIAPHPDDEVIGCWSVLQGSQVCYGGGTGGCSEERYKEAQRVAIGLNFECMGLAWGIGSLFVKVEDFKKCCKGGVVLAPDPHFELQPLHRQIGAVVSAFCRELALRFVSYSTSMTAPYVRELPPLTQEVKRNALDKFYSSQASLWAMDHRYFLFEGLAEWNPIV